MSHTFFANKIEIGGLVTEAFSEILTDEALHFVATLHREFINSRAQLLQKRKQKQAEINTGQMPDFLKETRCMRNEDSWRVAACPNDLRTRHVEITGPVDRKMMINALNSGANVFVADFEDANSPTWKNIIQGQINLRDAVNGTITFRNSVGKDYKLNDSTATLMLRPRGWHLSERHVLVDDQPISASIFDFGLYFFHNAKMLLANGSGPYFYLPKLENHLEARLWNAVFSMAQEMLGIPRGTIRATVLIENILASFEMEEILYELRDHSAGLNAGRWDYIFSVIKKFRNQPSFMVPDRAQISMRVPFMRAYTELLVRTCHKRGAHAIGGMAAFIPSRNPEINTIAFAKVREDKKRESADGFDGTWVAHPGLVPLAKECFVQVLGNRPHQISRLREDVKVGRSELLNFSIPGGEITEQGLRTNINVALLYIESWLQGLGAAALYNLMENAATAEISRAQVWQWLHSETARMADGRAITAELYEQIVPEELQKIEALLGAERFRGGKFVPAREILDNLVKSNEFEDFLTIGAYEKINQPIHQEACV